MKILDKLTIRHLKSNPKRTIVTIIGVILSTSLMVGIGLIFSTIYDNSVKLIEISSGTHHASMYISSDQINLIKNNDNVKDFKYKSSLGVSKYENLNTYKPYIEVFSASENYLKDLNLLEGRLPLNENEILISKHLIENIESNIKLGDKIKLNLGTRVDSNGEKLYEKEYLNNYLNDEIVPLESLVDLKEKEYEVVGIVQRDILEKYVNPGYSAFTVNSESDELKIFITYKNIKDTIKNTDNLSKELNNEDTIEYNKDLLSINGIGLQDNLSSTLISVIIIILFLVSAACIIVIYNAFAISVMERKKQFGLFSSIGATKKQLKHTVFFESFIVGLIGIPLGILAAYLGIGVVLIIINRLLPTLLEMPLSLVTYPIFIIIPVIFMIFTIIISAYIPAKIASRVSPIEAIRQNDDIKIKSKKIKSPKFISKIFKIEGEISYKNIKRNKKKYRITIISLFISIVLFISFSSLVKYGLESSMQYLEIPDYDYAANISGLKSDKNKIDNVINEIINFSNVKESNVITYVDSYQITDYDITYSKEYLESDILKDDYMILEYASLSIVKLEHDKYLDYKKSIGLKDDKVIVINNISMKYYYDNNRKIINFSPYSEIKFLEFGMREEDTDNYINKYRFDNIYLTDIIPLGISTDITGIVAIVDEFTFNKVDIFDSLNKSIYLKGSNFNNITKILEDLDNDRYIGAYYYDILEEMHLFSNLILVVKILLYGFIALVTLIGVTSVLNTINTSLALRRKEFAVLRSIGLTPGGFNKILFFESLFFGIKSLLYGIPAGIIVTYLLHYAFNDVVEYNSVLIPWDSIFICIASVFIIILISNYYASRKMKKENILDAIRQENI